MPLPIQRPSTCIGSGRGDSTGDVAGAAGAATVAVAQPTDEARSAAQRTAPAAVRRPGRAEGIGGFRSKGGPNLRSATELSQALPGKGEAPGKSRPTAGLGLRSTVKSPQCFSGSPGSADPFQGSSKASKTKVRTPAFRLQATSCSR